MAKQIRPKSAQGSAWRSEDRQRGRNHGHKGFVAAPAPKAEVHQHPIRWDNPLQLWMCSAGCGFSRPKRPGEFCPGPDYGQAYAPMITAATPVSQLVPD